MAVCATCHGKGLCPKCGGTGTQGLLVGATTHPCELCGGGKKCPVCLGSGQVADSPGQAPGQTPAQPPK